MNKVDKPLTISDWSKGIASSPHVGFGDMRNLDIFSRPGVARIGYKTAKKSGSTVTNTPKWFRRNPNSTSEVYAFDAAGGFYKSTDDGGSWSAITISGTYSGVGQGLEIAWDYAFLAADTTLFTYGPLSGSANCASFKTIDSDTNSVSGFSPLYHPMLTSKNDGKIYGGAGRYIYSLEQLTTFNPVSAGTYTWTQQALDLPAYYRTKCLCEQGENLLVGTWVGNNIYDTKVADIFPWDRSSSSYGLPLSVERHGVHSMLNINSIVYFLAGIEGEIFSTNSVQSSFLAKIPLSITGMEAGYWIDPLPGALINHRGRPFFGISGGNGVLLPGMGVYSLTQTAAGNILNYEHIISTGNDGTSARLVIGALLSGQINTLLIGWQDGSSYGIDQASNQIKYTQGTFIGSANSYPTWFESPLYRVGTSKNKKQFTQVEFQLAKDLATGQGIKLKFRTKLSDTFTTIGTYDFNVTPIGGTYLGPINSFNQNPVNIPACEFIQIRGELTTDSSSATTPELRSVELS